MRSLSRVVDARRQPHFPPRDAGPLSEIPHKARPQFSSSLFSSIPSTTGFSTDNRQNGECDCHGRWLKYYHRALYCLFPSVSSGAGSLQDASVKILKRKLLTRDLLVAFHQACQERCVLQVSPIPLHIDQKISVY